MGWEDLFIYGIFALLGALGLFLVGAALYGIYRVVFLAYGYKTLEISQGVVTDMEYTPSRTTTSYNGKTTTVHHTPEKNVVYFKTEQAESNVDSDRLYQRVRIDDEITVEYQQRFARPRFWYGEWEFDGLRLISITNPKGRKVEFNDEKPVTRNLPMAVRKK